MFHHVDIETGLFFIKNKIALALIDQYQQYRKWYYVLSMS